MLVANLLLRSTELNTFSTEQFFFNLYICTKSLEFT